MLIALQDHGSHGCANPDQRASQTHATNKGPTRKTEPALSPASTISGDDGARARPAGSSPPASARRFRLRHREYVKRRIGNQAMAGRRRMNAVPEQVAVRIAADGGTVEACVGDIAEAGRDRIGDDAAQQRKGVERADVAAGECALQTADRAVGSC